MGADPTVRRDGGSCHRKRPRPGRGGNPPLFVMSHVDGDWSLIVKHNRRRRSPRAELEAVAASLPRLPERALSLLD